MAHWPPIWHALWRFMAKRGGSGEESEIAGVVSDLRLMHVHGAEAWRTAGGACDLQHISKLHEVRTAITDGVVACEAIRDTVEGACGGLTENYANAALAYLGYAYACRSATGGTLEDREPGRSPTARRRAAAKCIPISLRRFGEDAKRGRFYAGCRYDSYESLLVNIVGRELLLPTRASQPDPNRSGQVLDVRGCYRQTPHAELAGHGFFNRDSTLGYIDDLAALATGHGTPITIYAGSGVSADVGAEPLRNRFMERLVHELVLRTDLLQDESEEARKNIAGTISMALARTYEAPYLGSIVRELAQRGQRSQGDWEADEDDLRLLIRNVLRAGPVPGQFVARAIAACAFAMRHASAEVGVVTSHYDEVLTRAAEHVRTPLYLPEALTDYRFVGTEPGAPDRRSNRPTPVPSDTEVSVTHLNGSMAVPGAHLVIGESDFFAEYGADLHLEREHSEWRHRVLSDKLERTACIFVGSTLTEPDVLEHLARTKYRHRRYALLLHPSLRAGDELNMAPGTLEHYASRRLVAQRFLHLGVIPIIAEHPHQIPQFLREVALKIMQGETYQPYSDRARFWWRYWAEAFGHRKPDGPGGRRSDSLQQHWQTGALAEVMKQLGKQFAADKRSKIRDETIVLELWVRNPYQRRLELWARSDALLLDAAAAYQGSLRGDDHRYVAVKAFQEGRALTEHIAPKKQKKDRHWRYCWSIPLVLYEAPWYHLPVGVLNVMSNKDEDEPSGTDGVKRIARLVNIAKWGHSASAETIEELEEALKEIILRELDPKSATWESSDRTEWKRYVDQSQRTARTGSA